MLSAHMGATASHPWTPWMEICLERGEIGLVYTEKGFSANVEIYQHAYIQYFYLNITSTTTIRKQ